MEQKPVKKDLTQHEFYSHYQQVKARPRSTIFAAGLLFVFLLLTFFVLPNHLPWEMQKLLAVVNATLVLLLVVFAVSEYVKKPQGAATSFLQQPNAGPILGGVCFLLTFGWWLTPLAPIRAGIEHAGEIAQLLNDEVSLAVLVMPDTTLAFLEAPVPPPRAVWLAGQISSDADVYSQLLAAVAQRKRVEVERLAKQAEADEVDAELVAVAVGQSQVFAGRYADALPHFDRAAAASQKVSTRAQQAVAYALSGKLKRAAQLSQRLLEEARAGSITGHDALGVCLNLHAAITLSAGRFNESLKFLEESQQYWSSKSTSPFLAASGNNQAVAYTFLPRKFVGASAQLDAARAIWGELYGENNAHLAGCLTNLGVLAIAQSKFSAAEAQLSEALALARKNYEANAAGVFAPLNALARLNTYFGRYPAAQEFCQDAARCSPGVPLFEQVLQATQGTLAMRHAEYQIAASCFNKALLANTDGLMPEHVFLAATRVQQAELHRLQKQFAGVEPACQSAVELYERLFGKVHPLMVTAENVAGWAALDMDKKPVAKNHFERAQKVTKELKTEIPEMLAAGQTLAGLAVLLPQPDAQVAIADLRKAIEIENHLFRGPLGVKEDQDVQTPAVAEYYFAQATIFAESDKKEDLLQAEGLLAKSLKIREKLLPSAHALLAETFAAYAQVLSRLDKSEEAAKMEAKAEQARELSAKLLPASIRPKSP